MDTGEEKYNFYDSNARVLIFSQRNINKQLFRSAFYEFEDIIGEVDTADFLDPQPNKWFKYGTRISKRLASDYSIALNPGISGIKIKNNYDIFFTGCTFARDLLNVKCIKGWRDRCKTAICWIEEIWASNIYNNKCFLEIASQFDHIIVNCKQSVDDINEVIGNKCSYLLPGIDTILFCPFPNFPYRFIDVYSVGRRSEETHRSLLKLAKNQNIFYVYDYIDGNQVLNRKQHRFLYANMAKRSKYFIANPAKMNIPEETNGQIEIGPRYFEGVASGAIMIGEYPKSEVFEKNFNWPDAVIHIPYNSGYIYELINELNMQPKRIENISRTNVVESLMRHDWVYRWEVVLKIAGLDPTASLLERKTRLKYISTCVKEK